MQIYSEEELLLQAEEWASSFLASKVLPRILLLGEMGTGKSTLARALLEALGVDRAAEGSPTFAIAHEYRSGGVRVIHADGYRLKSEEELEETGLIESLWDPEALVIFEWLDLFPETQAALLTSGMPVYQIHLNFLTGERAASSRDPEKLRKVEVRLYGQN